MAAFGCAAKASRAGRGGSFLLRMVLGRRPEMGERLGRVGAPVAARGCLFGGDNALSRKRSEHGKMPR